jgi:beta-lactamase class D
MNKALCLVLLAVTCGAGSPAAASVGCLRTQTLSPKAFATQIGPRKVAFFARDLSRGACYQLGPQAAHQQHTPWSSFKIPNLLIALETGVAPTLDHPLPWDPKRRPRQAYWPADWAQAQTLETAFRRSSAWYFQDLALQIGEVRYHQWLTHFQYGNRAVKKGDDAFWLNGSLQISAYEQVDFLSRLLSNELKVSAASLTALDRVSLLKKSKAHALYGKTGSGPLQAGQFDGPFEGWLVGYVKRPSQAPLAYALYVQGPDYASIRLFRQQMSETLLNTIGAWPVAQ